METLTYETGGRVARITLDRPERGNGITPRMPAEIAACVERANLDPEVHAIALAGNGSGFCGGYDLVASAEGEMSELGDVEAPVGSPLDPATIAANHAPESNWDPVTDYQFMARNVRGFMSLFHSEKPVLCKVHGYCVAGGTDMALCSDLLVIAADAKIGYPPARVWGSPTTAMWAVRLGPMRAKRLLLTGDSLTGAEAVEWGLATEAAAPERLDERFERLLERVARLPINRRRRACGRPRPSAPSSTASPATPRRATPSSAAPPSPASARRCASATSPSATTGSTASASVRVPAR